MLELDQKMVSPMKDNANSYHNRKHMFFIKSCANAQASRLNPQCKKRRKKKKTQGIYLNMDIQKMFGAV